MMRDYCAYCDDALFGFICDNSFYIKDAEPDKAIMKEVILLRRFRSQRRKRIH